MTAIFLFMATRSEWWASGKFGTDFNASNTASWASSSSTSHTLTHYSDTYSYGVLLDTSKKYDTITVEIQAAKSGNSSTGGKQTFYLGVGSEKLESLSGTWGTNSSYNYGSNKYNYNTHVDKLAKLTIKNATLVKRMNARNTISFWWVRSSGSGNIGQNSYVGVISAHEAAKPGTPVVNYPYANTTTYNLQPWISVQCTNAPQSIYPATLQVSTNNSTWVNLSSTVSGTTISYTGAIPSSLQFTSTGEKTLYFRATSDVGTSSAVSRSITIGTISPIHAGDLILNTGGTNTNIGDYLQIGTAINNISKYFTNNSYTVANVANKMITAAQINAIGTKLASFPPNKGIIIPQNEKIYASNHYDLIIANAIRNS